MSETWLPVGVAGNTRWAYNSTKDLVAEIPGAGAPSALGFFDPVPDDQIWLFERITISLIPAISDPFDSDNPYRPSTVLLFTDDRSRGDEALLDPGTAVDTLYLSSAVNTGVICHPFPLRLQGGSRLGAFAKTVDGYDLPYGIMRAQVTTLSAASS